jgi:hypothetical protein
VTKFVDYDETMRKARRVLVLAMRRAADCKNCHPDIRLDYRLANERRIELDVRMIPCWVHSVEITAALNETEKKVVEL